MHELDVILAALFWWWFCARIFGAPLPYEETASHEHYHPHALTGDDEQED
jgi:hypothetical protein